MSELTKLSVWQALQAHYEKTKNVHMRDLFAQDKHRFEKFSTKMDDILLDFSKNRIDDTSFSLLCELAKQKNVEQWRDKMFAGEAINTSEDRPVLHTALRNRVNTPVYVDGEDVMPKINNVLAKMGEFSNRIRTGQQRGYSGRLITDIVNIGIGGSDLGPHVVCDSMKVFAQRGLNLHFVSNIDPIHLSEILQHVKAESTLFIVSSKSFTTQDTLLNAHSAKLWFIEQTANKEAIAQHFVAVTANSASATDFGILEENIFEFWDWVGGRYSLWSAIGLPIVIYIGIKNFEALLEGAFAMDNHFKTAPIENNMPIILALLGVWYNNFFGVQSHVVIGYNQYLRRLPDYLQQLDMESNGKATNRDGQRIDYLSSPIIWGGTGSNCQHAFFQLLHQGTKLISADFLAPACSLTKNKKQHDILLANFFAQSRALMKGRTETEVRDELKQQNASKETIDKVINHKIIDGNKPSNAILFEKLDPHSLGAILAMYEHKVFVQGIIWNINSFDQWGVEYGKRLADDIHHKTENEEAINCYDNSTNELINYWLTLKKSSQN